MPRERQVAVIVDVNKPYDRKVVQGVAHYVRSVSRWSLYVEEEPLAKMPNLRDWRGDGVLANFDDPRVARALSPVRAPVVGVGGSVGGSDVSTPVPFVATDNERIATLAAEHLLDRGFRRFAYCGLPRRPTAPWVWQRERAFRRRVRRAGCRCARYAGRHRTPRRWESLQAGLTAWLARQPKPLGLMACNDARARHVLEACRRIGARVPEDVAVIGVDNDQMMCELADPPLTSVIQGTDRIGYEAAQLLDALIDGATPPAAPISVPPVGIAERRSTDTIAVEDSLIRQAVGYIDRHIRDRPQGPDVARACGVGRSTLDHRFKAVLGRTVHGQIERARIRRAQRLLRETDLPLERVAVLSGYSNVQYMVAVFRHKVGVTPGRYRRVEAVSG